MAWIEYSTQLHDHWKINRLKDLLNTTYTGALGSVSCLWLWCASFAPNGDLKKFTESEISIAAKWDGNSKLFIESLKKSQLLDSDMKIHDWKKHGMRLLISSRKRVEAYRKKGGNPKGWEKIRLDVMKRDNGICGYCGRKAYVVDHIYPISKGGTSDFRNLVASCKACNSSKGGKTLE